MSINKLISIRNPIIEAKELLGVDHDKDDPFMVNLATRAEKEIGSYFQYERTHKVLDVNQCTACLPNDAVLVEIAVMGDLGEGCRDIFATVCSGIGNNSVTNVNSNGLFLVVDLSPSLNGSMTFGYVGYSIQNNKIIFDNPHDGQKVTIQYLKFKTDCDGFLEIGENHVNAIKWYIVWMYNMRQSGKNYIDRDMIGIAREEWNRECRHARGEDNRSSFSEFQQASRLYNNPMSGKGLWQGMYTTLGNYYTIW